MMILVICVTQICFAQEEVFPGSKSYSFQMKGFHADYSQMGSKLSVHTGRSDDGKTYNIVMIMPDLNKPDQISTDVIGISTSDGSFLYRDFGFAVPDKRSFKKVEYGDDKIIVATLSATEPRLEEIDCPQKVFDGTFVYWQLVGMSSSVESFTFNRWRQTPQKVEAGMSATAFVLDGTQKLKAAGQAFSCRIYSAEAAPGTKIICYVSDEAPYLIRQEYQQGDSDPVTMLELTKVWR